MRSVLPGVALRHNEEPLASRGPTFQSALPPPARTPRGRASHRRKRSPRGLDCKRRDPRPASRRRAPPAAPRWSQRQKGDCQVPQLGREHEQREDAAKGRMRLAMLPVRAGTRVRVCEARRRDAQQRGAVTTLEDARALS